jgi:hypothetical protein
MCSTTSACLCTLVYSHRRLLELLHAIQQNQHPRMQTITATRTVRLCQRGLLSFGPLPRANVDWCVCVGSRTKKGADGGADTLYFTKHSPDLVNSCRRVLNIEQPLSQVQSIMYLTILIC